MHGCNIIGNTISGKGSVQERAIDPAKGEPIDPIFFSATDEEIKHAVSLAQAAEEEYGKLSGKQKARFLRQIAEEIDLLGSELIKRCVWETALPETRIVSERGRTVNQLLLFADLVEEGSWMDARVDTALPDRQPVAKPDLRRMLVPLGPIAVFCASNFPLAFSVAGGDTAAALAAGNPVIVKAHRSHPGTAELVGTAIARAVKKQHLPEGIFSLLHGPGKTVGTSLVTHPALRAASFTGSQAGGKALFDAAAARPDPIPVYAEMGSINPVFLLPEALAQKQDVLAEGLKGSVILGVGQFCTNPGLIVALKSEALSSFVDKVAKSIEGSSPGTLLNAKIKSAYESGLDRQIRTPGVNLVAQAASTGQPNQASPALLCVYAEVYLASEYLQREVFGPSTLFVLCDSRNQLLKIAHTLKGELTATIHGTDKDLQEYTQLVTFLTRKVGRIIFNGFPTGVEVCPSMHHGGPYPASTNALFTSVGTASIYRFVRPVCFQGFPDSALPEELKTGNPLGIWRTVDGVLSRE